MARISNAVKARYRQLNPDSAACFYCPNAASLDDLTPHPSAPNSEKEKFPEEWTLARVCRSCWGKIYTANLNAGPEKRGLMLLTQKRAMLLSDGFGSRTQKFIIGFENTLIAPPDTLQIDEHRYGIGSETFYKEEILELQGAMAIKTLGLPDSSVEIAIASGMASGNLDIERMDVYRKLLGLS